MSDERRETLQVNETLQENETLPENEALPESEALQENEALLEGEDLQENEGLQEISPETEIPKDTAELEKINITTDQLKEIAFELGLMHLSWPKPDPKYEEIYPESYYCNSNKEKLLLWYAENFRRQYHFVHIERKPLILATENECGIQKMVCTAIRPTMLPYPEFYTWQGCAKFVADHITYKPLDRPTSIPRQLCSPWKILKIQEGHCFEYSTLLVSFLVGSGYEAYVANGYATLQICTNDQTMVVCPYLKSEEDVCEISEELKEPKYVVKPPKDLRSKFILEMEAREVRKLEEEKRLAWEEDMKRIEELERPPPDPLFARRIHSWVVVLPGKKGITAPFFIEPSTGAQYELSSPSYLGLESIWDHRNYWVNLQQCTTGCGELDFNLSDVGKWEHLLVAEPWILNREEEIEIDNEDERKLADKHLDMPFSWSMRPEIEPSVYERRFPGGSKTIMYKKAKLERFAPYFLNDGLVTRTTTYENYDWTDPQWVNEYYEHRMDLLKSKKQNIKTDTVIEEFDEGRGDALKQHIHTMTGNTVEHFHKMTFYYKSRFDALEIITLQPLQMTEEFNGRTDFLYCRNADYGQKVRIMSLNEDSKRPVLNVVERYHRNPSKPASNDIRELSFAQSENKIKILYHYEEGKMTASTREFTKPAVGEVVFSPELTQGYNVDLTLPPEKHLNLYYLLHQLAEREEKSLLHLREIEDEMAMLLKLRYSEFSFPKLKVSKFDLERNQEAREGLQEIELRMKLESAREVEDVVDYLAPYLAQLGDPVQLTLEKAIRVRDECLSDCKRLLVDRANKIQNVHNTESENLVMKRKWFEEKQEDLSIEDEDAYLTYCTNTMFRIRTLELRLERNRIQSCEHYRKMENYLKNDPRLAIIYSNS